MNKIRRRRKCSLIEVINKYANNDAACVDFFMKVRYPTGYVCEKCGCTHYWVENHGKKQICKNCRSKQSLLAGTVFEWSKLPLFKLILGIYLFTSSNKGLSAIELASYLDVNYKTALLINRKLRCTMVLNNTKHKLDTLFYEADVSYFGASSEQQKKQCGTTKKPVMIVLGTDKANEYPEFIKMRVIESDTGQISKEFIEKVAIIDSTKTLNTDGKTTFNTLKPVMTVINKPIDYDDPSHRLKWLNIIVGNIKAHIVGIYHGTQKKYLPLFLAEQEWRFNNRKVGTGLWGKIERMLIDSYPLSNRIINNFTTTLGANI